MAQGVGPQTFFPFSFGLGVTKNDKKEHVLAVRVFSKNPPLYQPVLDLITKMSGGEFDLKYSGQIKALDSARITLDDGTIAFPNCRCLICRKAQDNGAFVNGHDRATNTDRHEEENWNQKRVRPLMIGTSVGHYAITCGSIGAFVKHGSDICILSNNHVIANQNDAKAGDVILQPGAHDGGTKDKDVVATLTKFVTIKENGNLVDAAYAVLGKGEKYDPSTIHGVGKLAGTADEVEVGEELAKFGRTTGTTRGKVTAIEMDNVRVRYSHGVYSFDSQIEVEGAGDKSFSAGGDSGSGVVNSDNKLVGLLFAGGSQGGSNGKGLTYLNYMSNVLKALEVEVVH